MVHNTYHVVAEIRDVLEALVLVDYSYYTWIIDSSGLCFSLPFLENILCCSSIIIFFRLDDCISNLHSLLAACNIEYERDDARKERIDKQ
jgi:hypothetical protein